MRIDRNRILRLQCCQLIAVLISSFCLTSYSQETSDLEKGLAYFQEPAAYTCVGVVKFVHATKEVARGDASEPGMRYVVRRLDDLRYCEEIEEGVDERREALFEDRRATILEDSKLDDGGRSVGLAGTFQPSVVLTWKKRLGFLGILFGYPYWERLTVAELFEPGADRVISEEPSESGLRKFRSVSAHGTCDLWLSESDGFKPVKFESRKGVGDVFGEASDGKSMLLGETHAWGFHRVVATIKDFQYTEIDGNVVLIGASCSVDQIKPNGDIDSLSFTLVAEDFNIGQTAVSKSDFAFKTPIKNGTRVNMLDGENGLFYRWVDGKVVGDTGQ